MAKKVTIIPTAHKGGLLQWRAYRTLEYALEIPLDKHKISAPEWKLLGLVYDEGEILATKVALVMDVKLPLVTRNVGTLKKKKLINVKGSKDDKRMKCITITKEGEEKLFLIDADVREYIGRTFQGVSKSDFETYKNVLLKIIQNKMTI